ncbi:MAG: ABC transporter substrate-binding protein [Acidimicrobiales bacterium]
MGAVGMAASLLLTCCGGASTASGSTTTSSSGASTAPSPKGTVQVGLLAEFSGTRATLGPEKLQGMQLAAQAIDKAGGCDGRTVAISEIDAPDPVDTTTSIDQALSSKSLSLIVGPDVNSYQTALPTLEKAKMVNFSYLGTPGEYTSQHWNYSFESVPSDAFDGAAMAYYAKVAGYKKVAVVLDATQGSEDLLPSIEKMAKHDGTKIVTKSIIPESAPSYSGYIQKVIAAHPQAVLFQLSTNALAGEWSSEWQQAGGTKIPLIGSTFTAAGAYIQAMGTFAVTHLVSAVAALAANNKAGTAFLKKFTQQFHTTPPVYASHFYDALTVACLAMDQAKSTKPTVYAKDVTKVTSPGAGKTVVYTYAKGYQLIRQGKGIKYYGVSGPMTYNANHEVTAPYQIVKTDAKGSTTLVKNISATALAPGVAS